METVYTKTDKGRKQIEKMHRAVPKEKIYQQLEKLKLNCIV